LLQPATESQQAVVEALAVAIQQLRLAMFCSGAGTVAELDASRVMLRS
jgi:isopentenyl diphosphate isomerase/L-lactate dehydrogenase-like FMN-dependent dehydrogenase